MTDDFLNFILRKKLCQRSDKILLAVSGGKDSMALLHLFLQHGFNISVAHANFQLRGRASNDDEKFVVRECKKHNVPLFVRRFDTKAYADEHHVSIQMAARTLRYSWFDELMDTNGFDRLATAHHLNDAVETSLLQLTRGAGLDGLHGISVANGKIIRPLLFATRDVIDHYVQKKKIRWREDQSNATDDYPRNFIRHRIIPQLKKLNPSLEESFADSVEKILTTNALANRALEDWRKQHQQKKQGNLWLAIDGFIEFPNPAGLLWLLIREAGFTLHQCQQVFSVEAGAVGRQFFSSSHILTQDRNHFILSPQSVEDQVIVIATDAKEITRSHQSLSIKRRKKFAVRKDASIAQFDESNLIYPLVWRRWRSGDRFQPLGMTHTKKISDFLVNQKIPRAMKDSITVLESAGKIVWVVGHRLDDRFKVTSASKKILEISLRE